MEQNLSIGICLDGYKIAVAEFNSETKKMKSRRMHFFELFAYLNNNKDKIKMVKVECEFIEDFNKTRLLKINGSKEYLENLIKLNESDQNTIPKLVIQMCLFLDITVLPKKPIGDIWKSEDGKITTFELMVQLEKLNISYSGSNTNKTRQATLICLY